jgi:hypothetical protein
MAGVINFDIPTYQRLKKEYQRSVDNKVEVFVFEGHELLTEYAKYLIEYLTTKFN